MTIRPELDALPDLATQIRRDAVRMIAANASGHVGGALGAAEILAALYGRVMRHDPADPDRDRFVLSNGHVCAAFYAALARVGHLEPDELATFRQIDGRLQGHPARIDLPHLVETSTGPLGQGFSVANGLALAAKLDGRPSHVFCLVGDGEMQEGQVWEGLMTAKQHGLTNLTLIISYNGLQIDGEVEAIKSLQPLAERLTAFGWRAVDIDGHDVAAVVDALEASRACDRPTAVIAHTVMGKGVGFMEDLAMWHGKAPSLEQARQALADIGPSRGFDDFAVPGGAL
jgi:transketolase